jgi:hypothetical protein
MFELVVAIAGAFGEHRAKEVDVGTDAAESRMEPRREALRQKTGGGMLGRVHVTRELIERVTVHFGGARANVKHVEPIPGRQGERKLKWSQGRHSLFTNPLKRNWRDRREELPGPRQ